MFTSITNNMASYAVGIYSRMQSSDSIRPTVLLSINVLTEVSAKIFTIS